MAGRLTTEAAARGSLGALVALAALAPGAALAQPTCPPDHVGCELSDVDFEHRDALFDGVMLDTGWVPAGSPIQVRFGVLVGGETVVELGGTAVTSWPAALDLAVPGRPGTGRLAMDYGFEVIARMRFNVSVGGIGYSWEGDIPRGTIPADLRVAEMLGFDPFVLPPSDPRPVTVMDATDPIPLYDVPLTSGLVSIPGFGGGFRVTATATLETSYRTERIEVSDSAGPIEMEGGSTLVDPDPDRDSFGEAKDVTILPRGVIGYQGTITLRPSVYISVAGTRFDLTPFDVDIPIADVEADSTFAPAEVHVPLPDVRVTDALDLGEVVVGGAAERLLTIQNDGEATLTVALASPEAPFAVSPDRLTVPPRSSVRATVRFEPLSPGPASARLELTTNDPDAPAVAVALSGTGVEPMSDAGVAADAGPLAPGPMDGGCGCRAARGTPRTPGLLLALAALLAVRRRRSRDSSERP